MGKLFATFFRERGLNVLISDQGTKLTSKELAQQADITIVSVPIDHTIKVIEEVLPHISKDSAIMDFTSVKTPAVKAMLKGKCEVLGLHPMFGNSNPIPGQSLIICPTRKSGKWSQWMENFLREQRVKLHTMTAKEHDKTMSYAQAMIHFAEITFADAIRRSGMKLEDLLPFTSKASEMKVILAARLMDQDEGLYGNMQIQNPYSAKAIKNVKKSVDTYFKHIQKGDIKAFKKLFNKDRDFLGKYCPKAYDQSSFLVDRLIELQSQKKTSSKVAPKKSHLAVLGPRNTYSDIAANSHDTKSERYYCKNIEEVVELVAKGKVKEGIVPIENKLHGTVRETEDALFTKNVHICSEIEIPINHTLISSSISKKSDIKIISSHPQALAQCKKYLQKNFPKADLISTTSTAAATEKLLSSRNKSMAVIAPAITAENPELKMIANHIEDEHDNSTTFIQIKRGKVKEQKNSTKTSIAFHFNADSPGSLFTIFQIFATAKINMTKIESRPTKAKFGDYIFYLDFEGSLSTPKIKKVIQKIEKSVAKLKLLGSY